jgi:hypothetical protein
MDVEPFAIPVGADQVCRAILLDAQRPHLELGAAERRMVRLRTEDSVEQPVG